MSSQLFPLVDLVGSNRVLLPFWCDRRKRKRLGYYQHSKTISFLVFLFLYFLFENCDVFQWFLAHHVYVKTLKSLISSRFLD